jgi:hypothetical protein
LSAISRSAVICGSSASAPPRSCACPAVSRKAKGLQGIDQCMDFGAQPAATKPDRLILVFFWGAGAVLVGAHDGAVDHRVFVVGIGGQMLEDLLPHPAFGPTAEPAMGVLPIAPSLRQIAPWGAGAVAVEHRLDESPIILSCGADMPDSSRRKVFDPFPLVVAVHIGSSVSLLPKPTLHESHKVLSQ